MNRAIVVGAGMLASTLILMLIKFTVDLGMSWIWVFAPMYLPVCILAVPWLVTVSMLWFHQKFGE